MYHPRSRPCKIDVNTALNEVPLDLHVLEESTLFYGGPYQTIPPLENDQYERI
jgi:hypothetical protein